MAEGDGDSSTVGAEEAYELYRLKTVIDMIAESVIVSHVCLPSTPVSGCCQTTWGCGICNGEFHREGDREWYDHASWCPRGKE